MSPGIVTLPPPKRWHAPFDPAMSESDVDGLLSLPPFDQIDAGSFPASIPLRGILQNDCRRLRVEQGDILIRAGDYGNSAFLVISGSVRAILDRGFPVRLLGRQSAGRRGWLGALSQLWCNSRTPESRDTRQYVSADGLGSRGATPENQHPFLRDIQDIIDNYRTDRMEAGVMFGEIGALSRSPRTSSVFADGPAEVLEIRWQGLRDLRKYSDSFGRKVDALFRERSLKQHLRATPLFQHLSLAQLDQVAEEVGFETHGDYDWYIDFNRQRDSDAGVRIGNEPLIIEEGHYVDGLVLIRAGFCRVSNQLDHGHYTHEFLGAGDVFGLDEVAHNWRNPEAHCVMQRSLRVIGYADVLRVPTHIAEQYVLPNLPPSQLPAPIESEPVALSPFSADATTVDQGMLEFLVENRFTNGKRTMLIDMDRCTRCDDCVRACAATHDNNPRFVRHGPIYDHFMVANACMHCADPVCMIGCPTGAIHRHEDSGEVVINDVTCIGCATCANACPYDNIRMVNIHDPQGTQVLNQNNFSPILKASKCDLCLEQMKGLGPACARACPHDAMIRADMSDIESITAWLQR